MNGNYKIGDVVMNNWTILDKLGEGSFGKVYEIERKDYGEIYRAALKVITIPQHPQEVQNLVDEGLSSQEIEQYFQGMIEEIVKEFALMAKVKGTAYVVSYEDHQVIPHSQGIGWDILIRMEKLTPVLKYAKSHPFTRRDVIRLGIHMCSSLELCQRYNIIHRDIKPDNIFVSENGDFKLGDFGIARTIEKTGGELSKKGTYNYMAPEVYKGLEYGFSVDMYSLGIVLYRLLNQNRLPFIPAPPTKITPSVREQALARRMKGESLPRPCFGEGRISEIINKATAYDPEKRYSSPGQMKQELEAILYEERDASVIYPEGDAIALPDNIYATKTDDSNENAELSDENEETGSTVSVFSGKGADHGISNRRKTTDIIDAEPITTKTKKTPALLYAILGIGLAALIGIGAFTMLGGDSTGSQNSPQTPEEPDNSVTDEIVQEETPSEKDLTDVAYELYSTGAYDECISYIEDELMLGKAFESQELTSELMEILGSAYYEKEDYAGAASYFRLSAAGAEMSESAMRDYAVCLARLGSVSEAKDVLVELRQKGAESDVTLYVEGEVAHAAKKYTEAENIFWEIIDYGNDSYIKERAMRSLAYVYEDCAELEQAGTSPIAGAAIKEADLLSKYIPKYNLTYDSSLYERLGKAAYEAHTVAKKLSLNTTVDYRQMAIEAFEKVLDLGIVKEYIYRNIYIIHYEQKDYTNALDALERMAKAFPQSYVPHALKSIVLITVENEKDMDDRNYTEAYTVYQVAESLLKTSDDQTYFQQVKSLIEQLQAGDWL